MKYKQISIEEIIKDFKAFRPKEQTISEFENELNQFLINAKKEDSEEYQKNEINKFLNKVFDYDCNVKGKIDSAIYEYGEPRVIFETKKINNKAEFVKENSNNLESKAFYESILYFLRENITNKNNNITFIILATAEIFYIIDAKNYLNNFAKNKEILKSFKNCEENGGTDNSTSKFYEEVKNILPKIENEIPYMCIDFKNILKEKDKLGLLYVLLSPQVLLKRTSYIDANTLNVEFYNELLYILGLKESKENGKIEYSEIKNTFYDSISKTFKLDKDNDFEDIFSLLITWNNRILFLRLLESMLLNFEHIENPFLDLEYLPDFNNLNILFFEVLAKKENERTNIPKKLEMIPYLNSSLFEKKELERAGNEIKFLQSNNLKIYQHSILKRDKNLSAKYLKNNKTEELPLLEYLFLFLHAYDFTTTLQDLQNNVKTNYDKLINSAVLGLVFEKLNGYKDGSFYTPSFITNYMCRQSLDKAVIEKFNVSLNWECKTIDDIQISLDRFITNKETFDKAIKIFNEIRICDPAVGSGHFLVSALNELLLIKYNLGLLIDEDGKKLKDIDLQLKNDEIVIKDSENNIHNYKRPKHENTEAHKIQRTIFFAKKEIIENNLFGVDINPNSCEITKLRLWIELLKYSYYKDIQNKYLETLPNIDINIKCGNSLISYFDINQSLNRYPNIQDKISEYKELVKNYKNGIYNSKNEIDEKIKELLESFRTFCLNDKFFEQMNKFDRLCKEYNEKYGNYLVKDDKDLKKYFGQKNLFASQFDEAEAKKDYEILVKKHNDIFNLEAKRPFEWRFAFPEVLDNEGNFTGFDLIIGNPPYIRQEEIKELKPNLQKLFSVYKGTSDIYTYFYEQGFKILKDNGILNFITSNKFTRAGYGEPLRDFLLKNTSILEFVDLKRIKSFERADVDTGIIMLKKVKPEKLQNILYASPTDNNLDFLEYNKIGQNELNKDFFIFGENKILNLKKKIEEIGKPLKNWNVIINSGIKTGCNDIFVINEETKNNIINENPKSIDIIKPMLKGRDIKRYFNDFNNYYLINTHNGIKDKNISCVDINKYPAVKKYLDKHYKRLEKRGDKGITPYNLRDCAYLEDFEKPKILWAGIMRIHKTDYKNFPRFLYDKDNYYTDNSCYMMVGDNLIYIIGILNSSVIKFYIPYLVTSFDTGGFMMIRQFIEKIPIPVPDESSKIKIETLVKKIIKNKKEGYDTENEENEINKIVYKLYDLSEDEMKIIENGI